jgi:hypothetical protein
MATAVIDGQVHACGVGMTDGEWFWYIGLIYYVEKYNVRLPDEYIEHAKRHGWRVNRDAIPLADYECEYFSSATQ